MNQLEKNQIQEINELHNEIEGYLKKSLEKAIRLGELLIEQKANVKHGEWLTWIDANLSFTDRTARNYMRLYRERDRLKTETISDIAKKASVSRQAIYDVINDQYDSKKVKQAITKALGFNPWAT